MKIIKSFLTKNPCYLENVSQEKKKSDSRYTNFQKKGPKGLMLHSVGCPQPSAKSFISFWNSNSHTTSCVHGFIDGISGDVYQTLPWNYRGWHCGSGSNGSGNNTHIGIEMCEPSQIKYTSGSSFRCSDKKKAIEVAKRTYKSAVELFAELCIEFKLDPTKDGVIISHREGHSRGIASNHGDPEHLWKGLGLSYTMNGFRKDVEKEIKESKASKPNDVVKESKEKESTPTTIYRVQVGSFTHLKYAKDLQRQMIKKGYDTVIAQSGNLYKVQVGAYTNKDNTDTICSKLRRDNIKYVITTESIVIVKD